jgi:acyl dehydratase
MSIRVRAFNTAADSENRIHDDAVASTYGFRGGLVPGVTVYGYLAAGAIEHFGPDWLKRGAMDVRFYQPIYDGDDVVVSVNLGVEGRVLLVAGQCASGEAWLGTGSAPVLADYGERPLERQPAVIEAFAPGTVLGVLIHRLDLELAKMSAPLDAAVGSERLAHPAILLALANQILVSNYELGPWIHAASAVRKFGTAKTGDELRVRGKIVDRYERKGHEFVVADIAVANSHDRVIEQILHTAIWRPRPLR